MLQIAIILFYPKLYKYNNLLKICKFIVIKYLNTFYY